MYKKVILRCAMNIPTNVGSLYDFCLVCLLHIPCQTIMTFIVLWLYSLNTHTHMKWKWNCIEHNPTE